MTHRSARASASKARRITSPLAAGAAVAAATGLLAMGMTAPAFGAVEKTVDDAVFSWSINDESTGGAYFGGCNFLVAGDAGDTGMARIWTAGDAGSIYQVDDNGKFAVGNTSVKKTSGELSSFADRCKWGPGDKDVVNGKVNAEAENNHTGDHVEIANGTGTVDADADNASIQWEGSWSFAYYGGMTYWTISDPKLEVKDGKGTITGTYSGYGTDMDDLSKWNKLEPVDGDIIQIQQGSVDVTDEGFEFTPDFLGVETDTAGRNPQAPKTDENESWWGAMPQDWIDFNVATGQDSYWYTTAGASTSIQPRKPANPVTVGYTAQAPEPNVSTAHTVKSATAEDGLTVNVTGDGYDNLPNSSLGSPAAGAYAAIIDRDLESKDVTAGNAAAAQYVKAADIQDGKLDVDVNAKTADLAEDKNYDVLTWVAHGFATGDAELYRESIELTDEQKEALFPSDDDEAEAEAESDDNGAAEGAEAEADDNGAADAAEAEAEADDNGAADAAEAEAEADDNGAADAAEAEAETDDNGAADGAEADDQGAADGAEAEADDNGAADAAEGEADDKGAADAAEADDNGAADAVEADDNGAADGAEADSEAGAEADDNGAADGGEADSEGAADGDDSDGSSDGDEERPAAPEVADQTVGEDRLVKGKATPNSEVNLAWTPVVENETDENAGAHVATFAAEAVPSEDNVTVTADDEGNFSTKAPSAKGTYAYSAIATVDGVPSDPAEFTVTVNEDEAADDDNGSDGSSDGAEGGSDSAGAADGSDDGADSDASGSDEGASDGAGSGSEGSSSGGSGSSSGSSSDGGSGGGDLPRTGADLLTLPIAAGLIVLGAASVMFSRMRKR